LLDNQRIDFKIKTLKQLTLLGEIEMPRTTAMLIGSDEWSRCIIQTEQGIKLCDINCHDADVILNDPALGDWHTMSGDGEPESRIADDIKIELKGKRK
jgi:hypothetical protein